MKKLITILLLFSYACYAQIPADSTCNCNENKKVSRFLNAESARLTFIPKFSPLIPINTDVTINGNKVKTAPASNWLAGIRFYYYSPNSILSFGSEINFVNRNLTINDNNHIEFNSQEIELSPYINLKTGKFDKLFHLNVDLGVAYTRKLYSIVNYHTEYRHTQVHSDITSADKLFATAGVGISRDIFRSDWRRASLFSIGFTYYHPIKANFFDIAENSDPIINDYRFYNSDWQYFTFTIGAYIFLGKNNNPYRDIIYPDSLKRFSLLRTPNFYDEPEKNIFGGVNFSVGYQPRSDTIVYLLAGDTLVNRFRPQYNYTFGYNLYFGNYRKSSGESPNRFHFNLYLGPTLLYRNYTVESKENLRFHTLSIGANSGLRFGFSKGIYLIVGTFAHYNLMNQTLIANEVLQDVKLFNKLDYNPYIGLGFRNIINFSVQQNPIMKLALNNPSFFNGLEWRVGIGF